MGRRNSRARRGGGNPSRKATLRMSDFDALTVIYTIRPSLSRTDAVGLASEFRDLAPMGQYEDAIPLAHCVRSLKLHFVSKDMEILTNLVLLLANDGRRTW